MSRLADRILTECQPFRASLLDPGEWRTITRKHLEERAGRPLSHKEFARQLVAASSLFREGEPVGIPKFDPAALRGVPVFAADDVGRYVMALPKGTDFTDVVASMAPPFDKFFVEFQGVPNGLELHAWGALITAHERLEWVEQFEGDLGKPRWVLKLETFLEREKGKPFGPVAEHYAGLAEDGTWFRHAAGNVWWTGRPVTMTKEPPPEAVQDWGDRIAQLLFPVLLAISFLHSKNIKIRAEAPSEKLSRKYEKKHGRRLVRYHVLDIVPMRRILEQYGSNSRSGLRRALHICRSHFKTFTADAPLLGRHTGVYWWDSQVRGSRSVGVVIKDYRVRQPSVFGKAYIEANENPPEAAKDAIPSKDPDSAGRGLAAHNRTQNRIAAIVQGLGWVPRSPGPDEPEFDIAWKTEDMLFVCEVKSLSPTNEERQLRMAVGQVIRYRQKLAAAGYEPVMAVIAVERPPEDMSWNELCERENIVLVWPDVAEKRLLAAVKTMKTGEDLYRFNVDLRT